MKKRPNPESTQLSQVATDHLSGVLEKYQSILEALPDLLFEVDAKGTIYDFHSYRTDLLAAPKEQIIDKRFQDILPESAAKICEKAILETNEKGFSNGLQYSLQLPKGEYWFEISIAPIKSDLYKEKHFIFLSRDITDRKKALESFKIAAERQKAISETSMDGIWISDILGNILEVNNVYCKLSGYSEKELLSMNATDLDILIATQHIQQLSNEVILKGNSRFETKHRKKDGSIFDVEASITYLPMEAGKFINFFHDISSRKQDEQQITKLNSNFLAFLENTPDFVYFKNKENRFVFCSQTLATITKHSSWQAMIGKNDFDVFPNETAQIYRAEEEDIYKKGKSVNNNINPYYDEKGNKGWVSTNKWPLKDATGNVIGLFGISHIVTDQIQKATELKEKMNALEWFQKMAIGRELAMIDLKKEINDLLKNSGKVEKYTIVG